MDKATFQSNARRLRPDLVAIGTAYLASADEAEDVVQDALLKLWMLCPTLHEPLDPLARAITRNLANDRLRRRCATVSIDSVDIAAADDERQVRERYEHVMRIVDAMPALPQLVIRLRHIEGMEYADIARLTGSTEAAIRKAVSRARKAIRDKYIKTEQQ